MASDADADELRLVLYLPMDMAKGHGACRPAHLLPPLAGAPPPPPPFRPPPLRAAASNAEARVSFRGWLGGPRHWDLWVAKLRPLHDRLWRHLGILDAIVASTYRFNHFLTGPAADPVVEPSCHPPAPPPPANCSRHCQSTRHSTFSSSGRGSDSRQSGPQRRTPSRPASLGPLAGMMSAIRSTQRCSARRSTPGAALCGSRIQSLCSRAAGFVAAMSPGTTSSHHSHIACVLASLWGWIALSSISRTVSRCSLDWIKMCPGMFNEPTTIAGLRGRPTIWRGRM
uniref:Uncharacterized protein n=1 Tax=Oryza glaberrima TaxID=4538 RepID=I1PGQ4_ORYGL